MKSIAFAMVFFVGLVAEAWAAPVSYLYDGRGRLRCVHYADLDRSVIYTYDAAGSRTQQETRAGACPAG
jgi:hypothetical protein